MKNHHPDELTVEAVTDGNALIDLAIPVMARCNRETPIYEDFSVVAFVVAIRQNRIIRI